MSESDTVGYLSLVLHCHLPYVRHPEHDQFLEENWLYEATTETYLPLLETLQGLVENDVPVKATISVSPPLLEMLTDDLLQKRWGEYVRSRLELMKQEIKHQKGTEFEAAARMYLERFRHQKKLYGSNSGHVFLAGLRQLWKQGHIELITSAATHALLPLLKSSEGVYAQIEQGCRCFERHFGQRPEGMWLPECAWSGELGEPLKQCGIKYCFLESHGILLADPRPAHGVFAPVVTPEGLVAFGRDVESSKQVWSSDEGYPGDFKYREFHRDIGYDAPYERVEPYLDPWGERHELGVKYHRVTGDVPMDEKEAYDPEAALDKAEEHARHFVDERCDQVGDVAEEIGRKPLVTAPYDAELFGHWWYEGPHFIEYVFRTMATQTELKPVTPTEYLAENSVQQRATPAMSTWGYKGYFHVWVNDSNDWAYRELQKAEEEMVALAAEFDEDHGVQKRALDQCTREVLLAQSSDWPFLISTEGAPDYAEKRLRTHLKRFWNLLESLRSGSVRESRLRAIEKKDNIFPEIDYRMFRGD